MDINAWLAERGINNPMCFCDLPTGWVSLVDRLITDLVAMGWDRDLHQVKEKFGGLRFYIGAYGDGMSNRINAAEDESMRTCERCGNAAEQRNNKGWYSTQCDACWATATGEG